MRPSFLAPLLLLEYNELLADFEAVPSPSLHPLAVQPLAGSAKKGGTPKVEIMCQGTHDALVVKLLTARGIPKAFIDVDLSKSKK